MFKNAQCTLRQPGTRHKALGVSGAPLLNEFVIFPWQPSINFPLAMSLNPPLQFKGVSSFPSKLTKQRGLLKLYPLLLRFISKTIVCKIILSLIKYSLLNLHNLSSLYSFYQFLLVSFLSKYILYKSSWKYANILSIIVFLKRELTS